MEFKGQGRILHRFNKKIISKYTRFLPHRKITPFRFFDYLAESSSFLIVSLKLQINDGFHFNFSLLQICPKNDFFNLETLLSCHHILHITLHKKFVFLAVTHIKYKNYPNFYKFLLLLSGDVRLNPGPTQRSPDINCTIWKPLNKKGLHFQHVNINSLLSKKDEMRCTASKTKAVVIGIKESNLCLLH